MQYYNYKVIEDDGRVDSGIVRLPYDNVFSAISYLEQSKKTVIYVKKVSGPMSAFLSIGRAVVKRNVKRAQVAEFLNNLSVMLRAGLTISSALKEGIDESSPPALRNAVDSMLLDIEMGSTFSESAKKYPHVIPHTVVQLIRIGEESSRMEQMLADGASHLKHIDQIISDTKQALIYPAFVIVAMSGGMFFWFYSVVPKILQLFKEMQVELPALTRAILAISNFLQANTLTVLGIFALVTATCVISIKKSKTVRMLYEKGLLKTPVFKTIISASNLAFISEYFSLLLNCGLDIRRSLTILVDAIQNELYRDKLKQVEAVLGLGGGVADSFRSADIFPPFVVRMVSVGEQSGTLPEQLTYISNEYRNRLNVVVASIGKMIEPIVLIVGGFMFATVIGGLFLPIYDLVSKAGTGG